MARYIDKDQVIEWIKQGLLPTVTNGNYDDWEKGADNERINFLSFINSLPEEPAIENLEEENPIEGEWPYTNPSETLQGEIENIFGKLSVNGIFSSTKEGFSEVISHFAGWQKQRMKEGLWDSEKVITWIALHAELYGGFNQGKLNLMCEDLTKAMED